MARSKKRSLIFSIMRMSVLPIAILGIIMTAYGHNSVKEGMILPPGVALDMLQLEADSHKRRKGDE